MLDRGMLERMNLIEFRTGPQGRPAPACGSSILNPISRRQVNPTTTYPALDCSFSTRAVAVSLSQHSISHIAAGAAASMLRPLYSDGHGRRPIALLFRSAAASVAVAGTQLSCSATARSDKNEQRRSSKLSRQLGDYSPRSLIDEASIRQTKGTPLTFARSPCLEASYCHSRSSRFVPFPAHHCNLTVSPLLRPTLRRCGTAVRWGGARVHRSRGVAAC